MAINQNTDAYKDELIKKIKENYLSVALGFLVFLVAVTLIYRSTSTRQKNKIQEEQAQEQIMNNENVHVVKPGESVSSIARDVLGSIDYAKDIISANNLKNPEVIEVGQELILPEVGKLAEAEEQVAGTDESTEPEPTATVEDTPSGEKGSTTATSASTAGKITGTTYTIQKGDTLMSIAERAYGNRSMYTKIMNANNLRSPNRIEAGMILKLPR